MSGKRTLEINSDDIEINSEEGQFLVKKNEPVQIEASLSLKNKIKNYMDGALQFKSNQDLSYNWILQDENIKFLCDPITSNLENLKKLINSRDLLCELKVFFIV
jgi:hypothetical protein